MIYLSTDMHPFEVDNVLQTLTILVDTREQPTARFKKRIEAMGAPAKRHKLDFGDYSAMVMLPNGEEFSLQDKVCIERKMDINELCSCFCQERARFTREFERAKEAGAKTYLLVENATWENIYNGNYRSLMNPHSLVASINAWLVRYDCVLIFCKPETTGKFIRDILFREMKERLAGEIKKQTVSRKSQRL